MRRFVLSLVILVGAGSAGHGQDNSLGGGFRPPTVGPRRASRGLWRAATARPANSSVDRHGAGLWDLGLAGGLARRVFRGQAPRGEQARRLNRVAFHHRTDDHSVEMCVRHGGLWQI